MPSLRWIRFRLLEAVADALAWGFFAAERRGVHLSWLARLALLRRRPAHARGVAPGGLPPGPHTPGCSGQRPASGSLPASLGRQSFRSPPPEQATRGPGAETAD